MTTRPDAPRGHAVVVQPDAAESWWQPVPANGYAQARISPRNVPGLSWSCGVQTIDPGCFIREHQHTHQEEALHFYEGEGVAEIDGVEHPIVPGTTVFVGPYRKHKFINTGDGPLTFFWVMRPGGLEDFFEAIGRKRAPGEPAPAPFERPADVLEIERKTVFARLEDHGGA